MIKDLIFMFDISIFIYLFAFYLTAVSGFTLFNKFVKTSHFLISCIFIQFFLLVLLCCWGKNIFLLNEVFYFTTSNLLENLNLIPLTLSFSLNTLSYSFSLLVLIIGMSTNIYLLTYFKGEAATNLFSVWLNAFVISMVILVLGANFFTIFLGWELIGLTSFFLINFWHTRRGTLKASFKAFIFNLFSDICLLGAFISFYLVFSTDDCETFIYMVSELYCEQIQLLKLGTILLIFSCAIKSVQILGHLWLPDSMEAPVPASSLIHSATLVSAGVFLLCKFNMLIVLHNYTTSLVLIGSLTACYGGCVAGAQTDMKKLLAYSTMSHCGFLWVLASLGNYYVCIFYLFLHGLFKATTFYCAGVFIRFFGTQDTRWMGNGFNFLRGDSLLLLFSSANLCGLPFFLGYFYKSMFLDYFYSSFSGVLILGFFLIALLTSLVYFFRLTYYCIFDFNKTIKNNYSIWVLYNKVILNSGFKNLQYNHIIATFSLFTVSLFIILIFFTNINGLIEQIDIFSNSSYTLTLGLLCQKIYTVNYLYFYCFYLNIFFWLNLITWKKSFNIINVFYLIMYVLIFFI